MNKTDPFKTSLTTKAIHLYNTFDESNENMSDLKVVFGKVDDSFLIVDMERDEQDFFYRIKDSHKIIVFKGYDELYNLDNGRGLKRTFNNFDYELRFISATWKFDTRVGGMSKSKWDGFVYSRHGGSQHKNWWYYGRNDRMAIHYNTDFNFYSQEKVIIAYVRCEQIQIDRYRRDFNHYIGGKNNIFCNTHKCPLISSTTRDISCSKCEIKKEYYRCCNFGCKICLRKICTDQMNQDSPNYISNDNNQGIDIGGDNSNRSNDDYSDDNNISNVCEDGEDCSGSNSEDINSYDDGCNNNKGDCEQGDDNSNNDTDDFVNDDLSLSSNSSDEDSDDVNDSFTDDFGEFLTSTDDADLVCGDDHDYFSNIDNIPTTNAGEKAFTIRDANQVNNPNKVSGHVILNQCGSLLS